MQAISKFKFFLCLLVITTFFSCNISEESNSLGTMTLSIMNEDIRTLVPDLDMNPVKYIITGTGPEESVFTETVITSEATDLQFDNLSIGQWSVVVNAYNSEDICVGAGSTEVTIINNEIANCSIVIVPLEGVGSLSLSVDWITNNFDNPLLKATLFPFEGEAIVLESYDTQNTSNETTTALFQFDNLNTGYYELKVELSQENSATVRSVDVVRIIKDQTTTGSITISKINQSSISIDISSKMEPPLNVSIAGAVDILNLNETINLSANAENYTDTLKYNWYINGTAVTPELNNELTFGENLLSGSYEISVTAFTTDGTRAGFASTVIEVKERDYSEMVLVTGHYADSPMRPYYIGKYELTYTIWHEVYSWAVNNGYAFQNPGKEGRDGIIGASPIEGSNKPVTNISWRDAVVWCNAYSEMSGKTPAYISNTSGLLRDSTDRNGSECDGAAQNVVADGYRLPTKDEWTNAIYGGQYAEYYTYAGSDILDDVAWYKDNSNNTVHDTGLKLPNLLGLYDILGNVYEYSHSSPIYDMNQRLLCGHSYFTASEDVIMSKYHSTMTYSIGDVDSRGIRLVCN